MASGMRVEEVQANTYVALRLPSDAHSIIEVKPNTYVK